MVRNKRAAPAAPAPCPPLVQTVPWGADRRKPRAPPPPTVRMPASSVEQPVQGVTPPPPGQQSTTRFCLGPYERRGGSGTAPDAADGGSIGMDSEGSSTDVGVCLDDSASDVSQESLVTSDSAVSSPSARRVGRLSPGAGSTDSAATAAVTGDKVVSASRSGSGNVTVTPINSAPSQTETSNTQVISVNSESAEETKTERSTVQVISTSPVPPKSVSVVALNAPEESPSLNSAVSSPRSPSQVISVQSNVTQNVTKTNISSDNDQKQSQVVSVSSTPLPNSSSRQNTPSPTVSLARSTSSAGSSTVFLSPGQPTESNSSETTLPPPEDSPPSAPSSGSPSSPTASSTPAASASQGSTSTVFLSPSQPASETSPQTPSRPALSDERDCSPPPAPQSPVAPLQQTSTASEPQSPAPQSPAAPQSPEAPAPQLPEVPATQSPGTTAPQRASPKAKAPQPPRKPPAPLPPVSSSPTLPASPEASPASPPPRQSPTLRQLQAPAPAPAPPPPAVIQTRTYAERQRVPRAAPMPPLPEHGFQFHLREAAPEGEQGVTADGFAGVRDYLAPTAPIHSCRGTVRGVKDRVRAGIATFLQDNNTAKTLKSREQGRLVVYVTSLSIIRRTFQQCQRVRQVLRQLMAEFEERDLFLSCDHQQELQRRLGAERVTPPQLFIDGNLLGGAEAVERLNESGELRRMLKPFKVAGPRSSCGKCGGFRMLPCTSCNGSKKSCHRNHFTEQWVVLRCGACDQSGLMRCDLCSRS